MIKILHSNKSRGRFQHDNEAQFQELFGKLCYTHVKFGAGQSKEIQTRNPISPVGTFLAGNAIDFKRLEPEIEIDPKFLAVHFPNISAGITELIEPENEEIQYREYQREAIICASKIGRGIIDSPTASGKSLIIFGMIVNLPQMKEQKTLVVVPNPGLVTQMCGDFAEYGGFDDYAPWKSTSQPFPDAKVVFVSRTILKAPALKIVSKMGFSNLIMDEIHKLQPDTAYEKIVKTIDTKSIFGLTGTMPESDNEKWFIKGTVGPVFFKEHAYNLQEQDFLARINIISVLFKHLERPDYIVNPTYDLKEFPTRMYTDEYQYLESHQNSIDWIAELVSKLNGNTMILFDHTEHGHKLFDSMKGNKLFVDGSVRMDDREDIKKALETNHDLVLVAQSTCFGTGISIKNISNVIICSHSKKVTKIIQQVGRGLRKTKAGAEYMHLFDIHHNFKYSERHACNRMNHYKQYYGKFKDKEVTVSFAK